MAEGKAGAIFDRRVLQMILRQAAPYKKRFAFTGLLVVGMSALVWIRPALIRHAVDVEIPDGDTQGLLHVFLAVVGLLLLESLLQYRIVYLANWVAQSVSLDLRGKLFRRLTSFSLKYFDKTPVGQLVTRLVSDIDGIANVFSNGILNAIGDLLSLFVIIGTMLVIDWQLALWALCPIPVLLVATRIFQKLIKKAFVDVRNEVARINEFVQEHVTGMHIVQAFNREDRESARFAEINGAHRDANIRSVWAFSVFFPVVELLSATSVALLLWLGIRDVVSDRLTLGLLLQFILYVFMLYRPIRQLADRFNVLQMGIVNSDRVFKLLALDESEPEVTLPAGGSVNAEKRPWLGEIRFDNVSFAYQDEDWVLRDVSFLIPANTTAAFVGVTGAGKTTLMNLLGRYYRPQKGIITIDGENVADIPLDELRTKLGVVLQDVFLFSGSLRENVTLHDERIGIEALREAAEAIGAKEFIESLPDQWEQDVRERGASLSVGQRQLIAFLRAYVHAPAILILDEATSSIDSESELLIQRATERITEGRTSVLIAHRLSTVKHADRIFVLEAGAISESGSHAELMDAGGKYHALFEQQYKGERGDS